MSIHQIIRITLVAIAAAALVNSSPTLVQAGNLLDQTGCSCCPVCDHVCKLEAEEVEVEKTCFNVEAKAICIPRVVFPWQRAKKAACSSCDSCAGQGCTACVHNGARVRKVCVLTTEKYKCPACEYTWTAEKKDSGGCCGGGTHCDSPSPTAQPIAPQADELPSPPAELPGPPAELPSPVERVSNRLGDYVRQPLHLPLLNRSPSPQY